MNTDLKRLSLAELEEYARDAGRALRHLHDGEIDAAIELYRRLQAKLSMPSNVVFLARAYQQSGRICEAISTLEDGARSHPHDHQLGHQLEEIRERRHELLLRYVVSCLMREASQDFCRGILAQNSSLADETLREMVRQNAYHYAQQMNPGVLGALSLFFKSLSEQWTDDAHRADVFEIEGLHAYVCGDMTMALQHLRAACEAARRGGEQRQLISCLNHLGLAAHAAGAFAEAEAAYREAIQLCESIHDPLNAARFQENLANSYMDRHPLRAMKLAVEAENRYRALGEAEMALKARSLRAKCLTSLQRYEEALVLLDECIEKGRLLWSDMPIVLADALTVKANVLESQFKIEEAETLRRSAEELYRSVGVQIPHHRVEHSGTSWMLNRYEEGRRELEEAILRLQSAGMEVQAAREKMNLAGLYMARVVAGAIPGADPDVAEMQENIDGIREAHRLLEESIETFEQCGAHQLLVFARMRRADLLAATGEVLEKPQLLAEAGNEYDRLIEFCGSQGFEACLPPLLDNKALLLQKLGREQEAAEVMNERVAMEGNPKTSYECSLLAGRLADMGKNDAALRLYERAVALYDEEEKRVGQEEFVIEWSRSQTMVFDEAVEFLSMQGRWESAFGVVQQAKARTLCRIFSSTKNENSTPPPRRSPAEIAKLLE